MFWQIFPLLFFFIFFFGGPVCMALGWTIRRIIKHREKMQELKNEVLRLQLLLAQENRERSDNLSFLSSQSGPKQASWEEQQAFSYRTGYAEQSS